MIDRTHRAEVQASIPGPKFEEKRSRTVQGVITAIFGALLATGAFGILVLLIVTGAELTKWSVGIVLVFFLAGVAFVAQGSHNASGELTSAAWRDMASTVRYVWRRNGNGGTS
jgi:hypothetical protein